MGCASSAQVRSTEPIKEPEPAPGTKQVLPLAEPVSEPDQPVNGVSSGGGMSETRRRLSVTGGPAGEKVASPAMAEKRRRLSVTATPTNYARMVMEENLRDPNNDSNNPTIKAGKSAGLPLVWVSYSRPGNDPMKRAKENQDSCVVMDRYAGQQNMMFVGVFDGHGPNGGLASQFITSKLPEAWAQGGLAALTEEPLVAMTQGCLAANKALTDSNVDVDVSGSTGISSLIKDETLYVANVGDSRAVLARMDEGGHLKAIDLSQDHKPDRPDEMQRIIACGGRVFSWGVPRVWLSDVDMPGLAMSRSYGDSVAETVGVFAEPELSQVTLGSSDRFIIWATDGVWEFISSQEAVDIVQSRAHESPLQAAAALVSESTKRWRAEEDVVDDTTVVLAFLNYR